MRSFSVCRLICLLLALALLTGCGSAPYVPRGATLPPEETTQPTTVPTEPAPTSPPDGSPEDVTCKGSYLQGEPGDTPVAWAGEQTLSSGLLNAFYALEISAWLESGPEALPDNGQDLDTQMCAIAGKENLTWQQFFLERALDRWHTCAALMELSKTAQMPIDPEYAPIQKTHDGFLKPDLPMIPYLYGWDPSYQINRLHQEYLDGLPELLQGLGGAEGVRDQDLLEAARLLNEAYAYYTFELFHRGPADEDIAQLAETIPGGRTVSFRHLLLTGSDARAKAEELKKESQKKLKTVYDFAVLANENTEDAGSRANGGLYEHISQGQMAAQLDEWLFDPERQVDDLEIIESPLGIHLVWYLGSDNAQTQAEQQLTTAAAEALAAAAREAVPMDVEYSAITLSPWSRQEGISPSDLLYPDIAHEHIPDLPIYLQQDFLYSNFGAARMDGSGCGICAFSMVASYMSDEYLTPAYMGDAYGRYCVNGATDSALMIKECAQLGFYVDSKYYDWRLAKEVVSNENMSICLQFAGPYTSTGHYMVVKEVHEDGTLGLGDSNIYNYGDVPTHWTDHHPWDLVGRASVLFIVYQPKVTRIEACARCGGDGAPQGLLNSDYICSKCIAATTRREDFLTLTAQ